MAGEIDDQIISINGYHSFRNDRSYGRGGGVCGFVSIDIPCERRRFVKNCYVLASPNQAVGSPDGIANRILKEFACELADPVSVIFNAFYLLGWCL